MTNLEPLKTQASLAPGDIPTAFESAKSVTFRSPYHSGLIIRKVIFNNTGTRFALTHNDRHIRIWQADKPDAKASFEIRGAHDRPVEDVSWNPLHSERLASCSTDGFIKLWDTRTRKCLQSTKVEGEILVIRYSTDGQFIAVGLRNDQLIIFDLDLNQVSVYQENDEVYDISWSNGSDILAVSMGNGNVRLLGFNSRALSSNGKADSTRPIPILEVIHTLRGNRTATSCIQFDPLGRYLAVGSNEGIVSLWDTREWICLKTFSKVDQPITSIGFSHDGQLLAIASDNNSPISIVWVEADRYIYTIPKQNYVGRPAVSWHPLKLSLAYSGEAQNVSVLSK